MTSWAVLDSSILLATVLPERFSQEAIALLTSLTGQQTQIAVPTLFHYEIVAVLRKHAHRGALTAEEAESKCDLLLAQPVQAMIDAALLRRGLALATQFNRPTAYDAQYLAVAERLGCDFWTADERLYNAVNTQLAWVHWLGGAATP
jgi:predicted nucleic acid-binding protein